MLDSQATVDNQVSQLEANAISEANANEAKNATGATESSTTAQKAGMSCIWLPTVDLM